MATKNQRQRAAAQAVAPRKRALTTRVEDSAKVVQETEGAKIQLEGTGGENDVEQEIEMITAIVPKAFTLTRNDGQTVQYPAGVTEMPVDDAAHWFARAQGVKVYVKDSE